MRWEGREESENVEDRRGQGSGGRMMMGGGIGLIVVVIAALLGGDPAKIMQLLQGAGQGNAPGGQAAQIDPRHEPLKHMVGVVLKDTEDVWGALFAQELKKQYRNPTLVLFSNGVESGCGFAQSQMGPFYCPGDEHVYIDLSFYDELKTKFGASGDFAMAYVVAHEIGHHVQKQTGYSDLVHSHQRDPDYNQWSVRLELQADFLAGVWAHHAQKMKNILEEGDIGEALNCASKIGDDTLQKRAQGRVVPDAFTHGTSEQRKRWFSRGAQTGDLRGMKQLFEIPYDRL